MFAPSKGFSYKRKANISRAVNGGSRHTFAGGRQSTAGGFAVIGTHNNEARRVDLQLLAHNNEAWLDSPIGWIKLRKFATVPHGDKTTFVRSCHRRQIFKMMVCSTMCLARI